MLFIVSMLFQEIHQKQEEQKLLEEKELERQKRYINVQDTNEEQNALVSTVLSLLWNIAPFVLFASFLYVVQIVVNLS